MRTLILALFLATTTVGCTALTERPPILDATGEVIGHEPSVLDVVIDGVAPVAVDRLTSEDPTGGLSGGEQTAIGTAVLAGLGLLFRRKIMGFIRKRRA